MFVNKGDWISSVLHEIINRQNKRLSFLETYTSKTQGEKMRTMALKEQMDKEEIVHLKQEIGQLIEIVTSFHRDLESSVNHRIVKRKQQENGESTHTSSRNCVPIGKCCTQTNKQLYYFISF